MSIYNVLRKAERFGNSFRVCDSKNAGVGSCDQFLTELSLRDCSVYTQRAYAIGLAHFSSWLHASGGDPDHVTRQIVGNYITEFARGARQGTVSAHSAQKPRQPRTINHRLSVLASYFEYCIRRDTEDGRGPWKDRINPASGNPLTEELRHGRIGHDLPVRQKQRDGFRRRIPRTLPKILEAAAIQKLIDSAASYRDKAILILLSRAGQRIGDWSPIAGRHGILGMELEDVDRKRRFITVRLKRVHAISTACPSPTISGRFTKSTCAPSAKRRRMFTPFGSLREKVKASPSAMRRLSRPYGTSVERQASRLIRTCSVTLKVAQEILGHSHLSTTADLYLRVDQQAMVTALEKVKADTGRAKKHRSWPSAKAAQYVFEYDDETISELERTIAQASTIEPPGGDS